MRSIAKILLVILLWTLGSSALGGWSGNGGGTAQQDSANPWFLGDKPIPYCLIVEAKNAPIKSAFHLMVKRATEKWQGFFSRYGLNESVSGRSGSSFPDKSERSIALNMQAAGDCGEIEKLCSPNSGSNEGCDKVLADKVLVLVGKPNQIVQNYINMNGRVGGAAIRTDYNHQTYRSGGIVWLNELSTSSGWTSYLHLMTHELGHVFGMKHDSCWVMAKNVYDLMNWSGFGPLGEIESSNWPYSFQKQDELLFTDKNYMAGGQSGFYPNSIVPTEIIKLIDFSDSGTFKVTAKIDEVEQLRISIRIFLQESPSGKVVEVKGQLTGRWIGNPDLVPSVYTLWHFTDPKSSHESEWYSRIYLYQGWVSEDLRGILDWNGHEVAVTLSRGSGMTLSLYFAGKGSWLTLTTVQNVGVVTL